MEEHKRLEETGRIEVEEETLEAVRQKTAWSVKQPLHVPQMHVIVHCRCLMHFKNPYACVLYNEFNLSMVVTVMGNHLFNIMVK